MLKIDEYYLNLRTVLAQTFLSFILWFILSKCFLVLHIHTIKVIVMHTIEIIVRIRYHIFSNNVIVQMGMFFILYDHECNNLNFKSLTF